MTLRRASAAAALVVGALVVPGVGAAEAPVTTPPTTAPVDQPAPPPTAPVDQAAPPTTAGPSTTVVPAPTTPAPDATEATVSVGDEVAYRAALATLSAAPTGLPAIVLTSDIIVDDGTDPTYTGTRDLVIDGRGFALDAVGTSRLLVMDSPTDASLSMTDVTVRNGRGVGDGGGVLLANASTVEVVDTRFEANEASGSGGALAFPEVASVVRSDFTGNVASAGDGGALDAATAGASIVIQESQFAENAAPAGDGGAVSAVGSGFPSIDAGVQRSTFIGNRARRGGALVLTDGGTITNSTIVGNTASVLGGGILAVSQNLSAGIYLTLTGNAAPEGANAALTGRDTHLLFSVFADPGGGGENCVGDGSNSFTRGHADDDSCDGPAAARPAELGPLVDNGGRTLTREPLPGSPLIDAIEAEYGSPSIPGGCARFLQLEGVDQRGLERPTDGDGRTREATVPGIGPTTIAADCDIGAVEGRTFVPPSTGPVPGAPPFTG